MNARLLLLLLLASYCLPGCLHNPKQSVYIEMLNAEKRALEDALYDLEYEYELLMEELDECRAELAEEGYETAPARPRPAPPAAGGGQSPDLEPPVIEEGVPDFDLNAQPPVSESLRQEDLAPEAEELVPPQGTDPSATVDPPSGPHIIIDPLSTGGRDWDGRPGDDGLMVVIRPELQKESSQLDPQSISVVLLDPQQEGEDARLARWDISGAEIARQRQQGASGTNYRLKLPWLDRRPVNRDLHLFVRYVDGNGQELEADQPLTVRTAADTIGSWTPRAAAPEEAPNGVARRATTPSPAAEPVAQEPPAPAPAKPLRTANSPENQPRPPAWQPYR